jgi:hypothetical protein
MSGSIQMPFFTGQPQQTLGGMPGQMAAPFGQPTGPTGSVNPMQPGQPMQPGPFGMPQGQAPFAPPPQVPPLGGQMPGMSQPPGMGGQASFLPQFLNPGGQGGNPNLAMFGQFAHLPLQPPGTFQPPGAGQQQPNSPAAALAALMASLQGGARPLANVPPAAAFQPQTAAPQTVAPFNVGAFQPAPAATPPPAVFGGLGNGVLNQGGGGGASEGGGGSASGGNAGDNAGGSSGDTAAAEAGGGDSAGQGGGFG